MKTLEELVKSFSSSPFLFVGSGISRRYSGSPSWEELLQYFASRVNADVFSYRNFETQAKEKIRQSNGSYSKEFLFPMIAELIASEFNSKWLGDPAFRKIDKDSENLILKGEASPFYVELAQYLSSFSEVNQEYLDEIQLFKEAARNSISGIITTNFDTLMEEFTGFLPIIGQEQLLFSTTLNIAEVYKIHGSVTEPNSLVICKEDYDKFNKKSAYLAAKLLTIFLEYPIIFVGYSLTDANIRNILNSIIGCLSEKNLKKLEDRFIFIEYNKEILESYIISPTDILIGEHALRMTKIEMKDFSILFQTIGIRKNTIPAKILRHLKEEFYRYTITNEPSATLQVLDIEDRRLDDKDLVVAIGKNSTFGLIGLRARSAQELYRDILFGELNYSSDDILHLLWTQLKRDNPKLPVFKYIALSTKDLPEPVKEFIPENFDDLLSNTITRKREKTIFTHSLIAIWEDDTLPLQKKLILSSYLTETEMDISYLEPLLMKLINEDPGILTDPTNGKSSNTRLLIRILDYLKYKKRAMDKVHDLTNTAP